MLALPPEQLQSPWSALIVTDPEGTILAWSPEASELYGYEAIEMVGRSSAELVPTGARAVAKALFSELTEPTTDGWQGRFRMTHKDGSIVDVLVRDHPIVADGHVIAIVGESTPAEPTEQTDKRARPLPDL